MERRKFTREFKLEAVRLIKDRGVSYMQASQDLNVLGDSVRSNLLRFGALGLIDGLHDIAGTGHLNRGFWRHLRD